MTVKPFSNEELYLISKGADLNAELQNKIKQALGIVKLNYQPKRHTWITSPPGAGKTFSVSTLARDNKIELLKLHGVASVSNLTAMLAAAVYVAEDKKFTVWIDDCDSLFSDDKSLNLMKGALDEDRNIWSYQMNLTSDINRYLKNEDPGQQIIGEAMQAYRRDGTVGVEIPTNNISFIITSNMQLTPQAALYKKDKPFWTPPKKKQHEAAIRSRVQYLPFNNLTHDESWGWLASIVMTAQVLDLDNDQKHVLLDWMRTNWSKLPDPSMRAVQELAAHMLNYPTDYINLWNMTLL
jgi:hypothetical protein